MMAAYLSGESRVLRGLHRAEDFVAAQGAFAAERGPGGNQGPRLPERFPTRLYFPGRLRSA